MSCIAILKSGNRKGTQCPNKAKFGDYCGTHKKYVKYVIKYKRNESKEWWVNGIDITKLRSKLKRLYRLWILQRNVKRLAQKWALKCAIEWRPPHGVLYLKMMSEMDGSL